MGKRILVLNVEVSGMNKYLFSYLKKRGWELTMVDVPFPKILKWWALISTVTPHIFIWRKRFDEKLGKLYKTPWAFKRRTKFCENKVKQLNKKPDLIFQISGMFAPYFNRKHSRLPYVTYNDYTIMLSYTMALSNNYSTWAPWPSQIEKWIKLENELYSNAQLIFTTNENARRSLINDYGIENEKVITVGYGLTLDEMPDFCKTYNGKTILFIGMDFERKGGFILLEAFRQVKETISEARLIIVGPNKEIFKIEQPSVEVLGCVRNRKIIEDLYKQASIFVMPSLCEPFGLVFLEAMAYKLPCIGTAVDGIPEIIEDGKTGFLVPPNDANSLAEKIISLLGNPELLEKMGLEGYKAVKEKFTWDKVGEKLDFYLKEYINKGYENV